MLDVQGSHSGEGEMSSVKLKELLSVVQMGQSD